MTVEWFHAPKEIIKMAESIIAQYHPHLLDCSIGFIMRSEAPISNGKVTLGKARKVSAEQRVHIDFDFIIWLADDWWHNHLNDAQRTALLDHELCHCRLDDDEKLWIAPHDVEEFNCIIERHGFWWPASAETAQAVQATLLELPKRNGRVAAVEVSAMQKLA